MTSDAPAPSDVSTSLHLVSGVCEAIKEDNDERITSLLDIGTYEESETPGGGGVSWSNNKVETLLQFYYDIIGCNTDCSDPKDEGFSPDQAHLVLEALLRVSSLDISLSYISW